jgi:hypothetical protein
MTYKVSRAPCGAKKQKTKITFRADERTQQKNRPISGRLFLINFFMVFLLALLGFQDICQVVGKVVLFLPERSPKSKVCPLNAFEIVGLSFLFVAAYSHHLSSYRRSVHTSHLFFSFL